MTKAIIFDFWGTIVGNGIYSPVKQVKFMLDIKEDFSEYVKKFEEAFMTKEHENLNEAFKAVIKAFKLKVEQKEIDQLIGMWNKNTLLARPYRETMEVLTDLKKDYKIILMANTDNFSVSQILSKYEMEPYFDYIYLSSKEGLLKSDPKSFERIMKELGLEKEDIVMVGDSMESDIKGAEAAGIRAILVDRKDRRDYPEKVINLNNLRSKL